MLDVKTEETTEDGYSSLIRNVIKSAPILFFDEVTEIGNKVTTGLFNCISDLFSSKKYCSVFRVR